MGVPLTEIDTQLPGKASQSPIGVHKDSLDVLTDSLDESHRKKHSVVDKKEEMAGMSLESSKVSSPRAEPDLPVHAKSPVTEAGRLISTSEVYQRDNFLSKMMQYCNGEQRADFPCQYDRDLHMKHKLGYANEKAIHFDMKHHNQALIQPLMYFLCNVAASI